LYRTIQVVVFNEGVLLMINIKEKVEIGRKKLIRIYRYLQALDQMRNPLKRQITEQSWTMWFHDLPDHRDILKGKSKNEVSEDAGNVKDIFVLKVKRPELTNAPEPHEEVKDWIKNGWQKFEGTVSLIEEKRNKDEDGNEVITRFNDSPIRVQQFSEWVKRRNQWLVYERPSREAMAIFERLYALYAQIERESEQVELVLGDGLLKWKLNEGDHINHPALLQKVQLLFEPSIPEFTILELEQPTELYTALFRVIPNINASALARITEDLEQGQWSPIGHDDTDAYLKRLITQLSAHGEFVTSETISENMDNPTIQRDAVFFLRKRSLGVSNAIESILADLNDSTDLPEAVIRIAGIDILDEKDHSENPDSQPYGSIDSNGENEQILFSKDANGEQLQIAMNLNRYGSVLVQGPPGTGKTHTIANLLGHLLAEGKNVLVTSHTAKALSVLRDKVVEPLRPLCVSVLDNEGSREQLEGSIDIITERLSTMNSVVLEQEIAQLIARRNELLAAIRKTTEELKLTRLDEYRSITIGGAEYSPANAARFVFSNQERHNWIPGQISIGYPLPLSIADLEYLYESNQTLTIEDEEELSVPLIDLKAIISPYDFENLVTEYKHLLACDLEYRQELWSNKVENQSIESLKSLQKQCTLAASYILDDNSWQLPILVAGKEMGKQLENWEELLLEVDATYEQSLHAQSLFLKYGPEIPVELDLDEVESILSELVQYIKEGKKINTLQLFLKPRWKKIINALKVNDQTPKTLEHFETLLKLAELKKTRIQLTNRWKRQVSAIGGPETNVLGEEPEKICKQVAVEIKNSLQWYSSHWIGLEQNLIKQGLHWEALLKEQPTILSVYGELLRIGEVLKNHISNVLESQIKRNQWNDIQNKIDEFVTIVDTSPHSILEGKTAKLLKDSLINMDSLTYTIAYERLQFLWNKSEVFHNRNAYLLKLKHVAPEWSKTIGDRQEIHGEKTIPGDPNTAWLYKQLLQELEYRAGTSMEELLNRIQSYREESKKITITLVEKKAWLERVKKTTLVQQSALQGWKLLMRQVGKGTGARAPRLLAEARKLMPICQTAVPVWIMPINRVVENFDPTQNKFDVVIIDEASQADVMALTALYLGKQIIVVGDDEQVSPEAVGQRMDEVQRLIDTILLDIPNASLYSGITSIYDLAKTSFKLVQLREHFRCVSPIIQFSNHLSYKGEIKPLRDSSDVRRLPHTVSYKTNGYVVRGKVNEIEALHVASLLIAATEQKEYQEATFGVISLLGEEQAVQIDLLLRRYLSAVEYKHRQVRCGNSAQFQGDERDVMFLSMIHGPSGDGPLNLLNNTGDRTKKRYNVAVSRARDQIWLVHSLDQNIDLKEGDLRKRLIQHMENPWAISRSIETALERAESEFEVRVMTMLIQSGYRVTPQWKVGAYRIDMVVEGGGKRLAIECDGDRWHPIEKIGEDMNRQAILERLGWKFVRIRGSQFFRNPDEAMTPVFEKLVSLGITQNTESLDSDLVKEEIKGQELKDRVIRRATELRIEWEEPEENYTTEKSFSSEENVGKMEKAEQIALINLPTKK
jgi:very-short-patch-repair endonuclease/DNA polymerase III delta prime subunit